MRPDPVSRLALAVVFLAAPFLLGGSASADEGVQLSLTRYQELLAGSQNGALAEASWAQGQVRVELPSAGGQTARVHLEASVDPGTSGRALVRLLPADVAISRAVIGDQDPATLLRRGGSLLAVITASGPQTIELDWLVPVTSALAGSGSMVLALPPLPGAALTVSGEGAASVEVEPAVAIERDGGQLRAVLPAGGMVAMRWGTANGPGEVRSARYSVQPDASGEGADVEASWQVTVRANAFALRLVPASAALIDLRDGPLPLPARVDGDWQVVTIRGAGVHTIHARFRVAVDRSSGQPQIDLQLDRVPITEVTVTVPGERAILFEPAVPLQTTVRGKGDKATTVARGFLPPSSAAVIRWTESRAAPEQQIRFNTETSQLVTLQEGVLRARVVTTVEVIRGKLQHLAFAIPDDVVVYRVEGAGVEDWRTFAASDGASRQVRISLTGQDSGALTIELQLEKVAAKLEGAAIDVPVLRPLGAFREMGVIALFDGDKVGFGPAEAGDGFTRAGQDALPIAIRKGLAEKVSQAFRHVGPPGTLRAKVAAAHTREVRFDSRVTTLYRIDERTLTAVAAILVELKSGRTDHLVVSLPEGVAEPRITAPSLNKAELARDFDAGPGRKAYDVRFTQSLEGAVQLELEVEMRMPKALGAVTLPDIRVHGAEVEETTVGVAADAGIEIKADAGDALRRLDADEVPHALDRRSDRKLVFAFRTSQTPWTLPVVVKRHLLVETLDAMATRAWLLSHLLDSGHLSSRVVFEIANHDRQYLRVTLPDGSRVLAVTSDGQAVKAVRDDKGAVAIPLPTGKTTQVEVRYEQSRSPLGAFGHIAITAPAVDVRVGGLQWLVRTPGDLGLFGVSTELTEASAGLFEPPAQVDGVDALRVPLPMPENPRGLLLTRAVHEPGEAALEVSFSWFIAPGEGTDLLIFLAALAALCFVAWRRASGEGLGRPGVAALVAGVVMLALKASISSIGLGEALVALLLVGAVFFVGRRASPLRHGEVL